MHDWLTKHFHFIVSRLGVDAAVERAGLLHLAVSLGRVDLVQWLLDLGAGVDRQDTRGRTPLFFAANRRMARTLLRAGARLDHTDALQHTPMHAAAGAGRTDVAAVLRKAGADIHALDRRGLTPLHASAMKGRLACTRYLLKHGADANALDRHGRHPLFYAVAGGHLDTALALMEGGAELEMVDIHGTAWMDVARLAHVTPLQACVLRLQEADATEEWLPWAPAPPARPRVAMGQEAGFIHAL